jgi:prevent-host-death family protein
VTQRFSISEARANLPALVDAAAAGTEVELTRRGRPVAVIVSRRELDRLRANDVRFRDAYRRFLEQHPIDEVGLDEELAPRDRAQGRRVSL